MDDTESPNKRFKPSPPSQPESADFVSFNDIDNDDADQYGYNDNASPPPTTFSTQGISNAPRGPHQNNNSYQPHRRDVRNDPRHAKDRPKSKHILPNHEPWILVRTKFGRRFVHNPHTGQSLWRIPTDVFEGVKEFEGLEGLGKEKAENARWAEEQLREMRKEGNITSGSRPSANGGAGSSGTSSGGERARRRRSESLQREDEEALMAELAADAERAEEQDVKEVVESVASLQPRVVKEDGYNSDSSYEEVEVTDSEDEDEEERAAKAVVASGSNDLQDQQQQANEHVEFGEDDIAYQLAAMEQQEDDDDDDDDIDLEAEQRALLEYDGIHPDEIPSDEDDEDEEMTEVEAITRFHTMLNSHSISPFTPWEKVISNEDLLYDEAWTLLPNTRARKASWEAWVKDAAAKRAEERKRLEQLDPKVPFLAFLAEKATPKLYWPEFKRKYRKEGVMTERRLGDKEREKLYRDFISRSKLPEKTRRADLKALLQSLPLRLLSRDTETDALPQEVLGHLHYASLPADVRDPIVEMHIAGLAPAPGEGEDGEIDAEALAKRDRESEKRANALEERERRVEEDRRKVEKEERWAKGLAKEAEREVRDAMRVDNTGLRGHL